MRTLSRPMFNMGGPIKQGIMTGIREPYKHGGPTGTGLVGDQRYPQTGGREHHAVMIPPILAGIATAARAAAPWAARMGARYLPKIKRLFGKTAPGKTKQVYTGYSEYGPATYKTVTTPGKFTPNWLGRDPLIQGANWARKSIFNPTTGGLAAKAARVVASPSTVVIGGLWYANGKWFNKKGEELDPKSTEVANAKDKAGGPPGGGDRGMKGTGEWFKKEEAIAREAKAKADKEKRIADLLDTMGYDKARKNAAYDALIDAGRMVSERGTLDPKNIGRELIDPIVAATSARFDKPQQIREAVGLMKVKADIAKQLEDPQVAEQRRLNIEIAKKGLNVPFSDQKIVARKTMTGQTAFDTAASSTSDNFIGNIIPNADWVKIKADIKEKSGAMDDITIITKWTNETIKGKDVPDGDYTVGDALVTIQEGQVVNVTR